MTFSQIERWIMRSLESPSASVVEENAVFLWRFKNVSWTMKLHLTVHQHESEQITT